MGPLYKLYYNYTSHNWRRKSAVFSDRDVLKLERPSTRDLQDGALDAVLAPWVVNMLLYVVMSRRCFYIYLSRDHYRHTPRAPSLFVNIIRNSN